MGNIFRNRNGNSRIKYFYLKCVAGKAALNFLKQVRSGELMQRTYVVGKHFKGGFKDVMTIREAELILNMK